MDQLLYTIGHSDHPITTLIGYLKQYQIDTVFDVRSNPYSRFHPQYRHEALKNSLRQHAIRYVFFGKELGARSEDPDCDTDGNVDFMKLASAIRFREGLNRLIKEINASRGCLLCAEKEPLSCHRTILVCRHLRYQEIAIRHILADGSEEAHTDTEKRMVQELGLTQMELFSKGDDIIERAYDLQVEKIVPKKKNIASY